MPPSGATTAGRHLSELVDIYLNSQTQVLSEFNTVSSDVFVSKFKGLTLQEHCAMREYFCSKNHDQIPCTQCKSMIQAAEMVLKNGIVPLAVVFKAAFPTVTYHSVNAKRRLLQMPVVAFRVKGLQKGQSQLYLMEKIEGLDYGQLANFLSKNIEQLSRKQGITKEELKQLLRITQSERERECIRYAIYKTSGATPTEARRLFGFENMRARASHVDTCIKEMQEIYEAVESLAHIQEQALQDTLGFESNSSESSDEEMDFTFSSSQFGSSSSPIDVPDDASLAAILCDSHYNWFEFVEKVEEDSGSDLAIPSTLEKFFLQTPFLEFSQRDWNSLCSRIVLSQLPQARVMNKSEWLEVSMGKLCQNQSQKILSNMLE